MSNLPKVVTPQRRGRASNPRLIDCKSDALPLSHRATQISGNVFISITVVDLRQAHLVLGWLTISICNQPTISTYTSTVYGRLLTLLVFCHIYLAFLRLDVLFLTVATFKSRLQTYLLFTFLCINNYFTKLPIAALA